MWMKSIRLRKSTLWVPASSVYLFTALSTDKWTHPSGGGFASIRGVRLFWLSFANSIYLTIWCRARPRDREPELMVLRFPGTVQWAGWSQRSSKDHFTETYQQVLTRWFQELLAGMQHITWIVKGKRGKHMSEPPRKRQGAKLQWNSEMTTWFLRSLSKLLPAWSGLKSRCHRIKNEKDWWPWICSSTSGTGMLVIALKREEGSGCIF